MSRLDAMIRYVLGEGHRDDLSEILVHLTDAGPTSSSRLAHQLGKSRLYTACLLRYLRRQGCIASLHRAFQPELWWHITNTGRRYLQVRGELDPKAAYAAFE